VNRVYTAGLSRLLQAGLTGLGNGEVMLVGPDFSFDLTDSSTPSGELTDAGYSRATAAYSIVVDVEANYPRVSIDVSTVSFAGFDSAADGVHGMVFLLSDGTPLASVDTSSSIEQFPFTASSGDPITVDVSSVGLIRLVTQG
jgi:hypothetical protein